MTSTLIEHAVFPDRSTAGRMLAEQLIERRYEKPVILALVRGGVPLAVEVARALNAPIDLVLVRKIGMPGHEELALGAVVDGPAPHTFINENIRRATGIDDATLEKIKAGELREIERRRSLYLGDRCPVELEGTTAILVDDGIATGATMRVALDAVRQQRPARLVVAAGVGSPKTLGQLVTEVDDVICLAQPESLHAISLHYEDFRQISDDEVFDLLASVR